MTAFERSPLDAGERFESDPPPSLERGWPRAGLRQDIGRVRSHYVGDPRLERLKRARPGMILGTAALSWAQILLAWWAVVWISPWLLPLALVVIGSRQRALGNVVHDTAHGNGTRQRWVNQWLLSAPMFEEFEAYRALHLAHHANLGDAEHDPDYLELPAASGNRKLTASRVYRHYFLARRMWLNSVLGALPDMPRAARFRVLAFWLSLTALFVPLFGFEGVAFFGLWLAARASVYHAIKVFTELADHVGLVPGSVYGFTRNCPKNWLSGVLHPHSDNYHLAHHLVPRVPTAKLGELHTLLMELGEYRAGHQCDSYFLGRRSVAKSFLHLSRLGGNAKSEPPEGLILPLNKEFP